MTSIKKVTDLLHEPITQKIVNKNKHHLAPYYEITGIDIFYCGMELNKENQKKPSVLAECLNDLLFDLFLDKYKARRKITDADIRQLADAEWTEIMPLLSALNNRLVVGGIVV